MILARIGDQDGTCADPGGCATGSYYMRLNVTGTPPGLDPVFVLEDLFQAWRTSWKGRPDHIRSEVKVDPPVLGAPGGVATMKLKLIDWQGVPLTQGGATVTVTKESGPDGVVSVGAPVDHGDGTYSVPLAATGEGSVAMRVVVDDGQGPVTLFPFTQVSTAKQAALAASVTSISTASGGVIPFSVDAGPGLAGRPYLLLASASGTSPGIQIGDLLVPLVADPVVGWSYGLCNSLVLQNTCGVLDARGAAPMSASLAPNQLAFLNNGTLWFSLITLDPPDFATHPVVVRVTP